MTPQDEADPDGIVGGAGAGGYEMPYDYVLVHARSAAARTADVPQVPRVFRVLAVLTNEELVGGPAAALSAGGRTGYWPPPGGPTELTRPRRGGAHRR